MKYQLLWDEESTAALRSAISRTTLQKKSCGLRWKSMEKSFLPGFRADGAADPRELALSTSRLVKRPTKPTKSSTERICLVGPVTSASMIALKNVIA